VPELAEAPPEILAYPDADPVARLYAEATDYPALLTAIRKRVSELNVSLECVDGIAGTPDRYLSKLTCSPPAKYLSAFSMFLVLGALGLRVALIHDPAAMERIQSRLIRRPERFSKPRKPRKERRPSRRILARRAARRARWQRIVGSASASPV
jgi:hypothetical protein